MDEDPGGKIFIDMCIGIVVGGILGGIILWWLYTTGYYLLLYD